MARARKVETPEISYTVTAENGLNLRAKPDKGADVVKVLRYGEKVMQDGDAPDGWIAVKGGYCMAEFLK